MSLKTFGKSLATVFIEDGHQKVMLPSGEVIPHLIETIVVDGVEKSQVTMTFLCNNVGSKEEAIELYKKE